MVSTGVQAATLAVVVFLIRPVRTSCRAWGSVGVFERAHWTRTERGGREFLDPEVGASLQGRLADENGGC